MLTFAAQFNEGGQHHGTTNKRKADSQRRKHGWHQYQAYSHSKGAVA